jgi:hypothetical protein
MRSIGVQASADADDESTLTAFAAPEGIDSSEIIDTVRSRPAPVISATAGLRTGP